MQVLRRPVETTKSQRTLVSIGAECVGSERPKMDLSALVGGFAVRPQIRKALLLSIPSIGVARMTKPLKFMCILRYMTLLSNSGHLNGFIGGGQFGYNWHRFRVLA